MELTLSNEKIKIKVVFYDSMIKLVGKYYFDKMPAYTKNHPMKYRKLKNGKVVGYAEFFIPTGFIYDAMCIEDSEMKQNISNWLTEVIKDVAKSRGIESPDK